MQQLRKFKMFCKNACSNGVIYKTGTVNETNYKIELKTSILTFFN
jgi:hypothetical protein